MKFMKKIFIENFKLKTKQKSIFFTGKEWAYR